MAKKRNLKKEIRYICGDVALEAILTAEYIPHANISKLNELVTRIADFQDHAVRNVTFTFDKAPRDFENRALYRRARKAYYDAAFTKFRDDFNNQLAEIVKELNSAIPQQQRDLCKEIAGK